MMGAWMTTYTGKRFYPLDPNIDDISIIDIAHHLSNECRYNGACRFNYTVGQHSVLGLKFVSVPNRLAFLLHDASEAYLKDMVKNVKAQMPLYMEAESRLQVMIYERFGVSNIDYYEVKRVDYGLMAAEARVLITDISEWYCPEPPLEIKIAPWSHARVERVFLRKFYKYYKGVI